MPGRCRTGSRPLRTRIEPSEYTPLVGRREGLADMGADCNVAVQQKLDKKTVSQLEQLETWPGLPCSGSRAAPAEQMQSRYIAAMPTHPPKLSMLQVLICGASVVTLSMGIRHGFGLWLLPITKERGWPRQSFALAIAIQNLSWGIVGIFVGMIADRFGAFRVLIGGALLYGLGLVGMALAPTPTWFALSAGILIGAAQAGTTYAVIYGVLGRQLAPERRSWAMGVAAAAGSFGQFLMVPVEGWLIAG